ncbi:MAG: hypothetical protein HKN09_00495 [Saprospiraceae bacterium]|nr:hypothetical protein [Saprospiraceae bacterium]
MAAENSPNIFKKLFYDMIPVILGILIALIINDWQLDVQDKQFVDSAMEAISKELEENIIELEKVIPDHERFAITIDSSLYLSNSLGDIIKNHGDLDSPNIKHTSWKAFLNQYMHLVDYEYISILAKIEEEKHLLEAKGIKAVDYIYNNIDAKDEKSKYKLLRIIDNIMRVEKELLKSNQAFMIRYESQNKD